VINLSFIMKNRTYLNENERLNKSFIFKISDVYKKKNLFLKMFMSFFRLIFFHLAKQMSCTLSMLL